MERAVLGKRDSEATTIKGISLSDYCRVQHYQCRL